MDTRLTALLPAALGIKNGDVKMIKNAGGVISHPFGSVIRSLLVAIFELGVEEIMVIAHSDCGACHMHSEEMLEKMKARGINADYIHMMSFCGVDFHSWLDGFEDTEKLGKGNGRFYSSSSFDSVGRESARVYHRLHYWRTDANCIGNRPFCLSGTA